MSNERHIGERALLAHGWISQRVENLLDAGCDDGNNTFLFSQKARRTRGIDINCKVVERAKITFPAISFLCCPVEITPFNDGFFDVIIMNDALEHVRDETTALNEIYRILKEGGQLIISTPHKGMFAFLDPANYKFIIKNKFLLRLMYGKNRAEKMLSPGNSRDDFHRHYTLGQLNSVLGKSAFRGHYKIERIFRSGLLLGILAVNLNVVLRRIIGHRASMLALIPLTKLAALEFWIPFGSLAYNIAISIRKTPKNPL